MGEDLYVGRIVAVARSQKGKLLGVYRVSSRSFANRKIARSGDTCSVVPLKPGDYSDNPYISYNCFRRHGNTLVLTNGSHTDPIVEKISLGYPPRDALALVMLSLDYEKDNYKTPRIACIVDSDNDTAFLGIVTHEKLDIRKVQPKKGKALILATYEINEPHSKSINSKTPSELAREFMGMDFTHPVCSISASITKSEIDVAIINP